MKHTAIEMLVKELQAIDYLPLYSTLMERIIFKAKEMERNQITEAWLDGVSNWDNDKQKEEYYNEIFR